MKIHLLTLVFLLIILPGCTKFISNPKKRLEGEWKLRRVERTGIIGWRTLTTGYEKGIFRFAANGFAAYIYGSDTLKGNWRLKTRWVRYRDENGNDQEGDRQELDINVYNFTTNEVLNLNFDDVYFKGNNNFSAVYEEWIHRYRYAFRRL